MKFIQNILEKTKNQPDLWIFYAFILVFPLTIRKVIFFYLLGSENQKIFNEYTGIYLYLSDIFIFFILFFWIVSILYTKNTKLSNINRFSPRELWITCEKWLKKSFFNNPQTFFEKCYHDLLAFLRGVKRNILSTTSYCSTWNIWKDKLILIPLLLVIWSFISISWSENQIIAFFRSIKILEFFLLYLFIRKRLFHPSQIVPRGTIDGTSMEQSGEKEKKCSTWNIKKNILRILIFWGSFQSILAIWQFISQKSLGLTFLKESIINPDILGVAKVIIGGEKYIRSYGLFPHPNILGGFLLLSLVLTYLYRKHFLTNPKIYNCSTWNNKNLFEIEKLKYKRNKAFFSILIILQIIALFLTFSKSAIIGLLIAIIYIFVQLNKSNVPSQSECSTWNNNKETSQNVPRGTLGENKNLFHVEQIKKLKYYFLLSFVIFGILLFYFQIDLYALFIQSLEERFIYLVASIQAISENLFWGLGNGQFVLEMGNYSFQNLAFWQYQPVHNVFLLILSELGMVGLFLFIWFLMELFKPESSTLAPLSSNVPHGTFEDVMGWNIYLKSILLGFIFIMIFDHYLWDIQQGGLMLWLVMGMLSVKE